MQTCQGCKHFAPLDSECTQLQGVMYCRKCRRSFVPGEQLTAGQSIGCPVCTEIRGAVDASVCSDGRPSVCCPGFDEKVQKPTVIQKGLFD